MQFLLKEEKLSLIIYEWGGKFPWGKKPCVTPRPLFTASINSLVNIEPETTCCYYMLMNSGCSW